MRKGKLIAIEGVDGAGTTTQARLLSKALVAKDFPVHVTREPSDGPVGMLIRQVLSGRLVAHGRSGPRAPRMETMALLFAADRTDHLEVEVLPNMYDGINVICDRYVHSSYAYQSSTATSEDSEALDWVIAVNSRAPAPDLTIVLEVPPDVAHRRRQKRSGAQDIYDDDELQERFCRFYSELPSRFPEQRIVVVDGAPDEASVAEACFAATLEILVGDNEC